MHSKRNLQVRFLQRARPVGTSRQAEPISPSEPVFAESQEKQVQRDLVGQQWMHGPLARNASVLLSVTFAVGYWSPERAPRLATWLALQVAVLGLGFIVNRLARGARLETHVILRLKRMPVLASGCVWGLGYPLLFGDSLDIETVSYLVVLVGMGCGATVTYSLDPWAVGCFVVPAILPLIGVTSRHVPWAIPALLLFVACMALLAHSSRAMMINTIRLGYQNRALLEASIAERAAMEAANASKARFLAAASHDLRQPVQAIALLAGALGDLAQGDDKRQHLLLRLTEASEHLRLMLEGMLDLSQVDAGGLALRPSALSARTLLSSVADSLQQEAIEHDCVVQARGRAVHVWADPTALRRVVQNLALNAVRHGRAGGMVLLAVRLRAAGCELQVWDDGPGISPGDQTIIFDEFAQLANQERDPRKGVGLGLPMVRRLCEQCGWELRLRSRVGHGSMFSVQLPLAAPPAVSRPVDGDLAQEALRTRQLSLWIVEEHGAVREALALALRGLGCDVRSFDSGQAALSAAQHVLGANQPGLVLVEDHGAGMATGYHWVRQIRQLLGGIVPAILLTGADQRPEHVGPAAEIVEPRTVRLAKPVNMAALIAHIVALTTTRGGPATTERSDKLNTSGQASQA